MQQGSSSVIPKQTEQNLTFLLTSRRLSARDWAILGDFRI
jgi:hypothetical protein